MILIKGGKIVNPVTKEEFIGDVVLDGEKIAAIVPEGEAVKMQSPELSENYEKVIDARGLTVAPGLVDVHVHFRDPGFTYKEDIATGAAASKKGGYTTVVCMANTKPAVDNVETLKYVIEEGKKTGIHVLAAAAISKGLQGKELTDMEALKEAGAAGFTDDGIPLMDEILVAEAMKRARELNLPLSFHEEDKTFIKDNGINHGAVSEKLGIFGSPALAEDALVARDCMIALHIGADVNIQHISSKNSVKMVKLAKELGAHVWAEVTPHHFALTEEAVLKHGALAKMNPPLRTEADRQALIEGLKDGSIDMIATDHAPHSMEEKARPLAGETPAPSGITGLETALALGITCLVKEGHLTVAELMDKMSYQPARLYHLDCGRMEEGAPSDLVIFDENEIWKVEEFASKASNSPFTGEELTGKVKYTICNGTVVYADR